MKFDNVDHALLLSDRHDVSVVVSWVLTPSGHVCGYQEAGGTYSLCLQCSSETLVTTSKITLHTQKKTIEALTAEPQISAKKLALGVTHTFYTCLKLTKCVV